MSELKFTDGMKIETGGEYRIICKSDGLYVVGHGFCYAVDSREEGKSLIADLIDEEEQEEDEDDEEAEYDRYIDDEIDRIRDDELFSYR